MPTKYPRLPGRDIPDNMENPQSPSLSIRHRRKPKLVDRIDG